MARRKNWSAEQIVAKLRQIGVQIAQGKNLAPTCKEAEIFEQSSRLAVVRLGRTTPGTLRPDLNDLGGVVSLRSMQPEPMAAVHHFCTES